MVKESFDVVIIGGGVIGSAVAYFLAAEDSFSGRIVVIEKDPTYSQCSTTLSAGSIRQQFSTRENIQISQYGAWFLKNMHELLEVNGEVPDVSFVEGGYLFLASENGRTTIQHNHAVQKSLGADIELLEPVVLHKKFAWLNVDDIAVGSFGVSGEGWFDPYSLLQAFRKKAKSLGVTYLQDEVVQLKKQGQTITSVVLRSGTEIIANHFVNAAGAKAKDLAALAGIQLPVSSRKRCVFLFDCREPIDQCPLVIDPSGVYFRPEGKHFICGVSPEEADDPESDDYDVQYHLFDEKIWPILANRVPAFESIKMIRAWAGHYAYNIMDQNAIIGCHPEITNCYLANGFSGHGLQQAPAVGRGLAELILNNCYQSLDLSRFRFERFEEEELVTELNVV